MRIALVDGQGEAAADVGLVAVLDVALGEAQHERAGLLARQLLDRLVLGDEAVDESGDARQHTFDALA